MTSLFSLQAHVEIKKMTIIAICSDLVIALFVQLRLHPRSCPKGLDH